MPQVDKATFLPIAFWTFTVYTAGYLFLNTTFLYFFLTSLKLTTRRLVNTIISTTSVRRLSGALLLFPLVSL